MNWEKSTSGAKKIALFVGDAGGASSEEALQELWRVIASEITPLNVDVDWDYIKLEIWSDSGRVIAFPASSHNRFRIEMAACQIYFPQMLQKYEEIDNENSSDDEEEAEEKFCEAISKLENEWIDNLEAAARATFPEKNGWKIRYYSSEDDEPIRETTV